MRIHQRDVAAILGSLDRIDEERQKILDLLLPDSPEEGDAGCPHPADQVQDRGTLDAEEYYCRACDTTFTQDPRITTHQE
jgi:hypothetical protein